MSAIARLMASVIEVNGCWVWQRSTTDGYGRLRGAGGRHVLAHRLAYESFVGSIPDGLQLDHLCRVRACCNPYHLEVVDSRTNTIRGEGVTAINAAKTACLRGHEFTADNTKIREGRRYCQTCVQIRNAARRAA